MFPLAWRIASAWIAVLSESASCARPEHVRQAHQRERGEADVHVHTGEIEQEESNARLASKSEPTKTIANITVLNYRFNQSEDGQKEWLLAVSPDTTDAQLKTMCENQKCDQIGYPSSEPFPFCEVTGTDTDVENMILQSPVSVLYIELQSDEMGDPPIETDSVPSLWGLQRIGADGRGSEVGRGVTIFIVDTGVRHSHQEFGGRAVPAAEIRRRDGVHECNGNVNCALDQSFGIFYGHGTKVASIAGGNSVGVAVGATIKTDRKSVV